MKTKEMSKGILKKYSYIAYVKETTEAHEDDYEWTKEETTMIRAFSDKCYAIEWMHALRDKNFDNVEKSFSETSKPNDNYYYARLTEDFCNGNLSDQRYTKYHYETYIDSIEIDDEVIDPHDDVTCAICG